MYEIVFQLLQLLCQFLDFLCIELVDLLVAFAVEEHTAAFALQFPLLVGDAVALAQERIEAVVVGAAADALSAVPHFDAEHAVFEEDGHEPLAAYVHDGHRDGVHITDKVELVVHHLAGVQAIGVNAIVGNFQIDCLAVEISNGRVACNIILLTTSCEQEKAEEGE